MDMVQFVYIFTYKGTSWMFPVFVNYEKSFYNHLWTGFSVNIYFQLTCVNAKEHDCWIIW